MAATVQQGNPATLGNSLHRRALNHGLILLLTLLPTPVMAGDLQQLQLTLQRHGFNVERRSPTKSSAYGQFNAANKTLLVSPLADALGISRAVLLHEAVHAAQSCPSGTLSLLGVNRRTDPAVDSQIRYILRHHYKQGNVALEQEAFVIQGQPDAEQIIIEALNRRC